ncbi:HigA family addiction module antitoxin [Collinsella tanakaei]|uniref:HigA family addiction module antitoxin n=1 Tax=Collinsella tanakaei TaxID=626935 RepID=UPI0025A4A0FC|nr:HigA family addiction module antitoxin [Collinsella tanakaei]MDM8299970.1 HigA family addiction module antitoxin [Collinsella tanakaei]
MSGLSISAQLQRGDSQLAPVTPGEPLVEELLVPMGVSQHRLAQEAGIPERRINRMVLSQCPVTADIDFRLCRFFGLSDGYWLRAQAVYDVDAA